MAGGTVPTRLYPDLEQIFAEGVMETSSTFNDLLPYRPLGQQGRGQGHEWQFQGLKPTAPPPSEYGLDLYQDLERLQLDLDSLALTAPDEPALDYTFDLEPDYDVEEQEEEKVGRLRHNDVNEQGRRERAVSQGARISDLKLSLSNLNLNEAEKKLLRDKRIEVPPCQPPAHAARDFAAWMAWRLQANKLLAALILIRSGRRVMLRHSEVYRKPLSLQNVHGIVRDARGGDREKRRVEETSLTGCPYIMYGIPRVRLPSKKQAVSAAMAAPKTKR